MDDQQKRRDAAMSMLSPGSAAPAAPVMYDMRADEFRFVTQLDWDSAASACNDLARKYVAIKAKLVAAE